MDKEEEKGDDIISTEKFYLELQNIVDAMGLNTAEGVAGLSSLDVSSQEFADLVSELVRRTNGLLTVDMARAKLLDWIRDQENVRDKMLEQEKEMELAKLQKRKALLPIWRCNVCGRADKPYIACYVAPFIVRYEEYDI